MTEAGPLLNQINLVVHDMDATLAFYRRLGLTIPDGHVWRTASGAHHVEVRMANGVSLEFDSSALATRYNAGWRRSDGAGSRSVIGFAVPSRDAVDARYADLVGAGYRGLQAPYDAFWGARYAIVEDPDGNHVGIMSPLDPARASGPPEI